MLCGVLLHAINLQHATDGFTSPPEEVHATDFIKFKFTKLCLNSFYKPTPAFAS
jgi:hypothetical protein